MTSSFILDSSNGDIILNYAYNGDVNSSEICVFTCKEVKAFISAIPASDMEYPLMDIYFKSAGLPMKLYTQTLFYSAQLILATLMEPHHVYDGVNAATAAEQAKQVGEGAEVETIRANECGMDRDGSCGVMGADAEEKNDQYVLQQQDATTAATNTTTAPMQGDVPQEQLTQQIRDEDEENDENDEDSELYFSAFV